MIKVSTLDFVILGLYLVFIMWVGIRSGKKVKTDDDFFTAKKSFGTFVLLATVCATTLGGSAVMGRAGLGYTSGIECLMTAVPYAIGMVVFSGISGKIHDIGARYNVSSIPGVFGVRFGKASKIVIGIMIAFAMMGTVASQITVTATIFKLLGNNIGLSYELAAIIATIVFIVYTASSGLFGVVYTDVIQFCVLLVFVYIMVPVSSISQIGGLGTFLSNIDTSYLIPHVDGRILGDIVSYFVITLASAEMWQRAFAAKDRKTAKKGMFLGTTAYAVCMVLVLVLALAGQQLLPNLVEEFGTADVVIPALATKFLPAGLTGLALAGILSVMMSTADSYLLVSVQTVVSDIGKAIKPDMSEKKALRLSRIMTVVLAVGALIIALYIQSAYSILTMIYNFYAAAAGIPALAALYWKKATTPGIIAANIGGFVVCAAWKIAGNPLGLGGTLPGALVCAILLVSVSLLTYKKHPSVMV